MGHLEYACITQYEFDDRTLAHLKIVIGMKLRRQESFFVSWYIPADMGGGRVSIWISPTTPLAFRFSGSRSPNINPVWVEALGRQSHTARGLVVIPEEEAKEYAENDPGEESAPQEVFVWEY